MRSEVKPLFPCYNSGHGPDPRCPHFPPLTMTPPVRGRSLRPQPTISAHRHQKAPCHPRPPPVPPPPAGIPHSKGRRLSLKPVISAHRPIPTESTPNPLLTSPARLHHRFSVRQKPSPIETDTPCLSKYQQGFLNISGESK